VYNKKAYFIFYQLILCFVVSVSAQAQSQGSFLDRRLESFSVLRADTHLALQRLANAHKIPIGLEEIPEAKQAKTRILFDIELTDCTIRDVLTSVTAKDPRYSWTERDGVINVTPVEAQDTFLDVIVPVFVVSNVNLRGASSALIECSVVREHIQKLKITHRTVSSNLRSEEQLKRFSLSIHNLTVRMILNETLKEGDGFYWVVKIYGSRDGGRDSFFMLGI
jgi:hypothetical protein